MGLDFSKLRGPECCAKGATDAYKQMLHSVGVRYHPIHGGGAATGGSCAACATLGGAAEDIHEVEMLSDEQLRKGLSELKSYESSLGAMAKQETIRRIAHAMKRAGIDVDPEGDLDAVVAELQRQLPNPKNGKTFASSAAAQEKVCRVIADVMNDEFSPGVKDPHRKFIDTSMSAVEVCRAVSERAHSFSSGVNVEFLAVHASIKHALRNLKLLDGVLDSAYKNLADTIEKSGDAILISRAEKFQDLFTRAREEHKRAREVLENVLHVQLPPAAELLKVAMQDQSDMHATIKRLRLTPGTAKFGDSLASAISGLGTAAAVASTAHRALRLAGVSVQEFVSSPSFSEFQRKLDARVESGEVPVKSLATFLRAAEHLRSIFDERAAPKIREQLEALDARGDAEETRGGARPDNVAGGSDSDSDSDSAIRRSSFLPTPTWTAAPSPAAPLAIPSACAAKRASSPPARSSSRTSRCGSRATTTSSSRR